MVRSVNEVTKAEEIIRVEEVIGEPRYKASNDNLKHFIKRFDNFEAKFYEYVDRVTKN